MKKSKLLLATPLMLAPVIATLPAITSCSKKSDVTLTGDFAKNVDIETYEEPLIIGEPYVISLSIKEDQRGKQYLPNYLTTVKSGDVELWLYEEDEEMSNGIFDYYEYIPFDNNTRAYLYINNVSGKISIEAATSELESITATPIEVTGSGKVEFEVGETANTASRILATGTLKNDDIILLTDYSIKLDGVESDYTFKTSDITSTAKTGTISYNGLTSEKFNFIVIAKTLTYLTSSTSTGEKIEKFASLAEAVAKYNDQTAKGDYIISIVPGEYNIASSITIKEIEGVNLLIKPLYWSEEEHRLDDYWVKLNRTGVSASSQMFAIDNTGNANGSVNFMGIQFNEPTITGTSITYSHISLGNQSKNINALVCDFEGDSENENTFYAMSVNNNAASNISFTYCEGEYLDSVYYGGIAHAIGSTPDFAMSYCSFDNCKQLFGIAGTGIQAFIDNTNASLMWDPAGTGDGAGMTITGTGTYSFSECVFEQIADLSSTGFVRIGTSSADTKARELIFEYCLLTKIDDSNINDVYNAVNNLNEDWSISWTDLAKTETGTAYGQDSGTTPIYWDHTPIA